MTPLFYAIVLSALAIIVVAYGSYYWINIRQERKPMEEFESKHGLTLYEDDVPVTEELLDEVGLMVSAQAQKHVKSANVVRHFKVGTCRGMYAMGNREIKVIYIANEQPGSGHTDDVIEWIEHSAKKEGYNVRFTGIEHPGFRNHLVKTRGYLKKGKGDLVKVVR